MESKEQLAATALIFIIVIIQLLTAISLFKLKNKVEEIEERQYEVNEYILNMIGR